MREEKAGNQELSYMEVIKTIIAKEWQLLLVDLIEDYIGSKRSFSMESVRIRDSNQRP